MDVQQIKQRFEIIGNTPELNRAIDVAVQAAPTDLSVLITGESGVGKEVFPKIIHQFSARKHGPYIAVNCGAIPEGTIDSELFGHQKGAFTGALSDRKGYFEEANNGTIFLDEIGELPLSTQVRLLRVLEAGEFIKVGSSKVQKTNVRVVAATNVKMEKAIKDGKFREDLFYRLSSLPISIPPLRKREGDISLLFRKFSKDFAEKYRMPAIKLSPEALNIINTYRWPGNIRQLKNITEQISILESERVISGEVMEHYIPQTAMNTLPAIASRSSDDTLFGKEREMLYKLLFEMKNEVGNLKKLVFDLLNNDNLTDIRGRHAQTISSLISTDKTYEPKSSEHIQRAPVIIRKEVKTDIFKDEQNIEDTEEIIEESLSLEDKEVELIKKALLKNGGKRKYAAKDLGISERTLYRKIKEYNIN